LGSPGDESHSDNRLRRRRIILLAVVALVVIAAVGGLLVSTQIKSPAQQAAQTKPPPLTRLTATVQRTVLAATVLAQAAVVAPKEYTPSTVASGGGGGGGGPGSAGEDVQSIVTRTFLRKGSYVGQGTVIFEVAGQPFFVLQGSVPAYRNLQPGESGQDVTQLQRDLQTMGYSTGGDTSGDYGPGTAAAVRALFQSIGYQVPQTTAGPKADRGAYLPLSDYAFVPRLPARLVKVGVTVGKTVSSGPTFALGNPVIAGQLNPSDAKIVRPGMRVTITEPGTGATVRGRVTSVSSSTASTASISGGLYVGMGVRPDQPLPMSLVGQDVSLTIMSAHSAGPVLAVPEAAVYASANGGIYVTKLVRGREVKVPVSIGMSGSGLLQVTPRQPGTLTAGDQVVTGTNYVTGGLFPGKLGPAGGPG
jgi:peptidoglycan hydrolase-like protein with peptidoglycan-binding domain